MCTLTYLLNKKGYELFFNRDEQRTRSLAIPPKLNEKNSAIYPIDPQGNGTWVAVNKQGLSLALLNNYQAPLSKLKVQREGKFQDQLKDSLKNNNVEKNTQLKIMSRGQLILELLEYQDNIIEQLQLMDLRIYQPFQLCIFPKELSICTPDIHFFQWNGSKLMQMNVDIKKDLPITSSSIDIIEVSQKRKQRFKRMVNANKPLSNQHKDFHFSTELHGKYSVNMQRDDAKTVSISHISINHEVSFEYFDNVLNKTHTITTTKES